MVPKPPLPGIPWGLCATLPPHRLRVRDTPLVSPKGSDLFPVLQLSPLITAKMHRANNAEPPPPSCSTAGFSIVNTVSGFLSIFFILINILHFVSAFHCCFAWKKLGIWKWATFLNALYSPDLPHLLPSPLLNPFLKFFHTLEKYMVMTFTVGFLSR